MPKKYSDLILEDAESLLASSINGADGQDNREELDDVKPNGVAEGEDKDPEGDEEEIKEEEEISIDNPVDEIEDVPAGEQSPGKNPQMAVEAKLQEGEDEDDDDDWDLDIDEEEDKEDEDELKEGEDSDEDKEEIKEGEEKDDDEKEDVTEGEDKDSDEDDLKEASDSDEDDEEIKEGEDKEDEDELKEGEDDEEMKEKDISEAVSVLGKDLSEEFKSNIKTVFESAVKLREKKLKSKFQEVYKKKLKEAKKRSIQSMTESINTYLDYLASNYMKENKVAIERGLRVEMTESFISKLHGVFKEHYVEVPEGKLNLIENLQNELETTKKKLDETITQAATLHSRNAALEKSNLVASLCESLTLTQAIKMKELVAENIDKTANLVEFEKKAKVLKEAHFGTPSKGKKIGKSLLSEQNGLKTMKQSSVNDNLLEQVASILDNED